VAGRGCKDCEIVARSATQTASLRNQPICAVKNRINSHSDSLKPICDRCGASLFQKKQERPIKQPSQKSRFSPFLSYALIVLIVAITCGILVTPYLIRKDFSPLITAEAQKNEILIKQYDDELAVKKALLEKELSAIDALDLRRSATNNYRILFEARKSFDKRFALSPREKTQLRMRNLSSDSTKSYHDAIRAVVKETSPIGADIRVRKSSNGIALHIDFDMSSMTMD
jgi:hypothetical protein